MTKGADDIKSMEQKVVQLKVAAQGPTSLKGGDGGGTFDDMEIRVARLEDDFRDLRSDLKEIRTTLGEIRVDLARKPSTAGIWGMIATVLAIALTMAFGTFAIADYASNHSTPTAISQPKP